MKVANAYFTGIVLAAIVSIELGCGGSTPNSVPESSATNEDESASQKPNGSTAVGDVQDDASQAEMERVRVALAKLSPDDAASAAAQRICPVSDELLGSMGPPIQVNVEGRTLWVCCDGCGSTVEKDPAKYLAKLEIEPYRSTLERLEQPAGDAN